MTQPSPHPTTLTHQDYVQAAKDLRCDVSDVYAVAEVEALGDGFLYYDKKKEWRPKILLERHILYRLFKQRYGRSKADKLLVRYPDVISRRSGGYSTGKNSHIRGNKEHDRLDKARKYVDKNLALESASWGMFQIMGFHWRALGYTSVVDFVLTVSKSEAAQLDAFVRFIKANRSALNGIRSKDFRLFASAYNGRGFAKHFYDKRMRKAEKKWAARGVNDPNYCPAG